MDQEILQQDGTPEQAPSHYENNVESGVDTAKAEKGVLETGAERREQASEAAAAIADSSLPTALPPLANTSALPSDDSSIVQDDDQSLPLVANDDDLIEKEWVDKAKSIVNNTKTDPYSQEKAVNGLQKAYKKKRYGREPGGV